MLILVEEHWGNHTLSLVGETWRNHMLSFVGEPLESSLSAREQKLQIMLYRHKDDGFSLASFPF